MKKALLFIGLIFSMISVSAEENVLQSIEIVPVKDTYNIVLIADKAVDVKKSVKDTNKIVLDMKGIRASKNLNTIYNNVSNVDTVMVEPSGNGISLFFQAENAQNASVTFDSLTAPVPAKETKSVKLSSPIESYAPIYKDEISREKTSSLFDKITKASGSVSDSLQDSVEGNSISENLNKLFSFGLIAFLAIAVIRLFRRKEPDMKIGLSQSMNDREIQMYKGMPNIQPSMQNYANTERPFTNINYGLNAYQKENINPYEDAPMTIHNPRLRNNINTTDVISQQNYAKPKFAAKASVMAQKAGNTAATLTQNASEKNIMQEAQAITNPNINNLKFLESMTAIYEKSGRHDLAQGLKASLSKNNILQ